MSCAEGRMLQDVILHKYIYIYIYIYMYIYVESHYEVTSQGVATISRLLKMIGLFCKRAL